MNSLAELSKYAEALKARVSLKCQLDGTFTLFIMMHEMPGPKNISATYWEYVFTIAEKDENFIVSLNRKDERVLSFEKTKALIVQWTNNPAKFRIDNT